MVSEQLHARSRPSSTTGGCRDRPLSPAIVSRHRDRFPGFFFILIIVVLTGHDFRPLGCHPSAGEATAVGRTPITPRIKEHQGEAGWRVFCATAFVQEGEPPDTRSKGVVLMFLRVDVCRSFFFIN